MASPSQIRRSARQHAFVGANETDARSANPYTSQYARGIWHDEFMAEVGKLTAEAAIAEKAENDAEYELDCIMHHIGDVEFTEMQQAALREAFAELKDQLK